MSFSDKVGGLMLEQKNKKKVGGLMNTDIYDRVI